MKYPLVMPEEELKDNEFVLLDKGNFYGHTIPSNGKVSIQIYLRTRDNLFVRYIDQTTKVKKHK